MNTQNVINEFRQTGTNTQIFTPSILLFFACKLLLVIPLTSAAFCPFQIQGKIDWEYSTAEKEDIVSAIY